MTARETQKALQQTGPTPEQNVTLALAITKAVLNRRVYDEACPVRQWQSRARKALKEGNTRLVKACAKQYEQLLAQDLI